MRSRTSLCWLRIAQISPAFANLKFHLYSKTQTQLDVEASSRADGEGAARRVNYRQIPFS
jgi:hypothetical protein